MKLRWNPTEMSNREKAEEIVRATGGDVYECEDWLNDSDDEMNLQELIEEWREIGTYQN